MNDIHYDSWLGVKEKLAWTIGAAFIILLPDTWPIKWILVGGALGYAWLIIAGDWKGL